MKILRNIESVFDNIAEDYYTFTPALPEEYIKLLQKTFQITSKDHIIDLGCGSGDLALNFAKYSSFVEGIDISKTMIDMAKKKDIQEKVTWIHKSVSEFDFGIEKYNLIFSFESFHLLPNQKELIQRFAQALKPDGILCIGWAMYAFDPPLKDIIEKTFANHGIPWDDWGAWTCPMFSEMVRVSNTGLSFPKQKSIKVKSHISTKAILNYFFSVSKTAHLNEHIKQKISQELSKGISEIYPSGESVGYDQYTIIYCKK